MFETYPSHYFGIKSAVVQGFILTFDSRRSVKSRIVNSSSRKLN